VRAPGSGCLASRSCRSSVRLAQLLGSSARAIRCRLLARVGPIVDLQRRSPSRQSYSAGRLLVQRAQHQAAGHATCSKLVAAADRRHIPLVKGREKQVQDQAKLLSACAARSSSSAMTGRVGDAHRAEPVVRWVDQELVAKDEVHVGISVVADRRPARRSWSPKSAARPQAKRLVPPRQLSAPGTDRRRRAGVSHAGRRLGIGQ